MYFSAGYPEYDYYMKFHSCIHHNEFNDGKLTYSPDGWRDKDIYDLSFLTGTEVEKLMIKSLKEGKDLVFEACKNRKIMVTQAMKDELEESQLYILE